MLLAGSGVAFQVVRKMMQHSANGLTLVFRQLCEKMTSFYVASGTTLSLTPDALAMIEGELPTIRRAFWRISGSKKSHRWQQFFLCRVLQERHRAGSARGKTVLSFERLLPGLLRGTCADFSAGDLG